jgi:hypothetical protein
MIELKTALRTRSRDPAGKIHLADVFERHAHVRVTDEPYTSQKCLSKFDFSGFCFSADWSKCLIAFLLHSNAACVDSRVRHLGHLRLAVCEGDNAGHTTVTVTYDEAVEPTSGKYGYGHLP